MKKILAQIVYGINVLVFIISLGIFFWTGFSFLYNGVAVWSMQVKLATFIIVLLPVVSLIFIKKIKSLKEQERFSGVFIWGVGGLFITLGILLQLFFLMAVVSMM